MPDLFRLHELTNAVIIVSALLFVATVLIGFGISAAIFVRLPADYFDVDARKNTPTGSHTVVDIARIVLRNVAGAMLVIIGAVLSLPGVPGQGLVTLIAGLLLLSFPGKRKLLYKILSRPRVRSAVNRLRATFSKPPIAIR